MSSRRLAAPVAEEMKPWSKLLGGKQKASAAPVQVQIPQHPHTHHRSHLSPPQHQPHQRTRDQEEQLPQHHHQGVQQPLQAQQLPSGLETGAGTGAAAGPVATVVSGPGAGLHKASPPGAEAAYEESAAEDDSIEDEFRRGMQVRCQPAWQRSPAARCTPLPSTLWHRK